MAVQRNLQAWADRQRAEVVLLAQRWAGTLEARAKTHAPWTDRTSNARNGLFGTTEVRGNEIIIRIGHTIEYGVFLELANEGRFAILKPTITDSTAEIFDSYRKLWM